MLKAREARLLSAQARNQSQLESIQSDLHLANEMSGNNQFAIKGKGDSKKVRDELAEIRDAGKENVYSDPNQFSGVICTDVKAESNQC